MNNLKYDVVVAGGGPSGFTAAISAARQGSKVLLIERQSFIGGVAASGIPFIDFFNKINNQVIKGIGQEFVDRLQNEGACLGHIKSPKGHLNSVTFIDPDWIKLIGEEMLIEAGVELLYQSVACDVKLKNNVLKAIRVANKGGLQWIEADCFIDSTGDADIAAFSGVPFNFGRELDGLTQASSLVFKLVNVDVKKVTDIFNDTPIIGKPYGSDKEYNLHVSGNFSEWDNIIKERDIFEDEKHNIWAGTLRENELTYVNAIRIAKYDMTDPKQYSQAEIEARKQLKKLIRFLNDYIPGMEKASIGSIASQIGIRETRRIIGEYILTEQDVMTGKKFDDCIAKNGYCIDIHDPEGKGWRADAIQSEDGTYDIPYRCIVPKDIENLLVVGRSISTTHEAQASTRIMPCCMALGQAAGVAASISSKSKTYVRGIDIIEIQNKLKKMGAIV